MFTEHDFAPELKIHQPPKTIGSVLERLLVACDQLLDGTGVGVRRQKAVGVA